MVYNGQTTIYILYSSVDCLKIYIKQKIADMGKARGWSSNIGITHWLYMSMHKIDKLNALIPQQFEINT